MPVLSCAKSILGRTKLNHTYDNCSNLSHSLTEAMINPWLLSQSSRKRTNSHHRAGCLPAQTQNPHPEAGLTDSVWGLAATDKRSLVSKSFLPACIPSQSSLFPSHRQWQVAATGAVWGCTLPECLAKKRHIRQFPFSAPKVRASSRGHYRRNAGEVWVQFGYCLRKGNLTAS